MIPKNQRNIQLLKAIVMTSKDFEGGETNIKHAVASIYTYGSCDLSGGVLRSLQGLDFSKKLVKEIYFFDLTFTDVHMGRQKST